MTEDEILSGVSSQNLSAEEMLDVFNRLKEDSVSNPKQYESDCAGNIATSCIRDGLREFSNIYQESDIDMALYGGLATQLRALADSGDLLKVLEPRGFGRRHTSDIDALVSNEDYGDAVEALREYDDEGLPNIDFKEGYIPGTEEIIENAENIDFSEYHEDYDFTLPVPRTEDLVYTKIFRPIGRKDGTRHDLQRHLNRDDLFHMNGKELYNTIRDRSQNTQTSMDILEEFGYDPRF